MIQAFPISGRKELLGSQADTRLLPPGRVRKKVLPVEIVRDGQVEGTLALQRGGLLVNGPHLRVGHGGDRQEHERKRE